MPASGITAEPPRPVPLLRGQVIDEEAGQQQAQTTALLQQKSLEQWLLEQVADHEGMFKMHAVDILQARGGMQANAASPA